jgi:hypothetical protein
MAKAQWLEAYEYMQNKGSLTSLTALTELGIISFPKRICEIERKGIKVNRRRIEVVDRNGNIKRVMEYSLPTVEESDGR